MTDQSALHYVIQEKGEPAIGVWGGYQLHSAFQPIFKFSDGRLYIAAFESLVRPKRRGLDVSPGKFFSALRGPECADVETLTRGLHLLNAGAYLNQNVDLFINFDPSIFVDQYAINKTLKDLLSVLQEASIDASRIVCEVTEHYVKDPQNLKFFVSAMREVGCRIAVDDYGADCSDMARIDELQPDVVKFDARWTTDFMNSRPGCKLLADLVQQFNDRGITTLFEGIEEPWQLELTEAFNVSLVQGFVLSKPQIVPASFSGFAYYYDEFGSSYRQKKNNSDSVNFFDGAVTGAFGQDDHVFVIHDFTGDDKRRRVQDFTQHSIEPKKQIN